MNKIKSTPRFQFYMFMGLFLVVAALLTVHVKSQPTGGTIYGCYKRNNGQLRIVTGPGQCGPSETEISWDGGNGSQLGQHHQESTFTIGPNSQVVSLPIPVGDKPVHIDFSATGQTDSGNVPVPPLVATVVVAKEAATGLVTVGDSFTVSFSCGGSIGVNEGADVDFTYTPGGCGQNPATVHVNMWY